METNTRRSTGRLPDALALAIWVLAGIAVIWAANHFGLWWATAAVGVVVGFALRGSLRILGVAAIASVAGWGLALLWQSLGAPIGGAAATVALIMGFGRTGVLVIVLALLFALLLALSGAWLGAALRRALWPAAAQA